MRKTPLLLALLLAALPLCGAEPKPAARLLFSATVRKTPIAVFMADRAFDPARHKTTPPRNLGTDEDPKWEAATVDGRAVVGTDEPKAGKRQLSRLYVQFGKRRIDVPQRLLTHIFLPQINPATFDHRGAINVVSVSADGRAVLIDLGVGDGEYGRTVSFYVGADGACTDEPLPRYEP